MPDLMPDEVAVHLRAHGLRAQDDADLREITHRLNAINEAVAALEDPDADAIEPQTVFWLTEEALDEEVADGR